MCGEDGYLFFELPIEKVRHMVSSPIGRRSDNPEDYVVRMRGGRAEAFLKRELALPAERVTVTLRTKAQYIVAYPEELPPDVTHVLTHIGICAWPLGKSVPYTPAEFVARLARKVYTAHGLDLGEILACARDIGLYWNNFAKVAD